MKKILTIGGGMRDVFIQYERVETLHLQTEQEEESFIIMESGRKIEVKELEYHCGGGAANSAVSFARLGFSTQTFLKVGNDQEGDFIIKKLDADNVGTQHIVKTDQAATGTSFILPGKKGNRTVLVYRGANLTVTESELPEKAISECDQVYITSLSGGAAPLIVPITKLAKKHKKIVAANPGTSQLKAGPEMLKEALNNIDILILNSYESQLLMTTLTTFLPQIKIPEKKINELPELLKRPLGPPIACFTLPQFFNEVHSHGPKIVVVTNGAEGVYVSDAKTIFFHPSLKAKIVSTIGAGDAFGSCFVGQVAKGDSIEAAVCAGVLNSVSVIEHLNTQDGLLTADELQKRCDALEPSLQLFPL